MSVMEVDLHKLKINDPFLGQYQQLVRDVVIPYQWDALNDRIEEADPSHAIENFRIAAGRQEGEFYGMVFQDSDVAKWLEAVAWSLCQKPDPGLEKTADEVIELVAAAQCEDGYLNTYFTVKAPEERWTNLAECHELYCAGHMIEAQDVGGRQSVLNQQVEQGDNAAFFQQHIRRHIVGADGDLRGEMRQRF